MVMDVEMVMAMAKATNNTQSTYKQGKPLH